MIPRIRKNTYIYIENRITLRDIVNELSKHGNVIKVEKVVPGYYIIHFKCCGKTYKIGVEIHRDMTVIIY